MNSQELYQKYLLPSCYASVTSRTRQALNTNQGMSKHTKAHLMARMRTMPGCNMPAVVRGGGARRGTGQRRRRNNTTANRARPAQRRRTTGQRRRRNTNSNRPAQRQRTTVRLNPAMSALFRNRARRARQSANYNSNNNLMYVPSAMRGFRNNRGGVI